MIAAFEGWNDAGEAASTALEHLELSWDAEPLAAIDPEDYYDFQVTRPHVRLADGVTRRDRVADHPAVAVAALPGTERHVVLVHGIEPNMRWRSFCRELLDHAERLGVTKVITLGALLTDTPHTRPTPVSGTSYDKASAAPMRRGAAPRYQGPTGIVGVFQDACVEAGIPAISFWASVPHYVSQAPVPKATVALLHRVEEVLDVEVPLGALPEQAEEWERTVSEMAEADDEVREYVRQLEEQAERGGERPRGRRRHDRRRLRALPAPPRGRRAAGARRVAGDPRSPPARRRALAGDRARRERSGSRPRDGRRPRRPRGHAAFIGPFGGGVTVAMLPELGAVLRRRIGRRRGVGHGVPAAVRGAAGGVGHARASAGAGCGRSASPTSSTRRRRCSARWRRRSRCSSAARALQGAANAFTTPLLFAALASSVAAGAAGAGAGLVRLDAGGRADLRAAHRRRSRPRSTGGGRSRCPRW